MYSPVLNRSWQQTIWVQPSAYAVFYPLSLVWVALLLFFGFTIACLVGALFFIALQTFDVRRVRGLSLTPEGACRYYASPSAAVQHGRLASIRHAFFWCHIVVQLDTNKREHFIIYLHQLSEQLKRRFNALCHNWSQEKFL